MNQTPTFAQFIHALGEQMGQSLDPAPGAVRLDLNGIPFLVAHDADQWGEENVMFACDFGPIPQHERCAILEALLQANRDLHGLGSPVFTMDPRSGHAVSMLALPLEGLDAGQTLALMMKHAAVVDRWRQDYFLEPQAA